MLFPASSLFYYLRSRLSLNIFEAYFSKDNQALLKDKPGKYTYENVVGVSHFGSSPARRIFFPVAGDLTNNTKMRLLSLAKTRIPGRRV